jgi:hypothetical protein
VAGRIDDLIAARDGVLDPDGEGPTTTGAIGAEVYEERGS